MSLQLVSPSRYGKTEWARTIDMHTYMRGKFDLEQWNYQAKYFVWDDVEWQFLPNKKEYVGCQSTITINPKYKRVVTLQFGIPVIFLTNSDIRNKLSANDGIEIDFFNDNCITLVLTTKLYV